MHRTLAVLFVLLAFYSTVDTRAIQPESVIDLVLRDGVNEHKQLITMMASYRHRFEHSPHFKALRWASAQQSNPPYCDLCFALVPVVRCLLLSILPHCSDIFHLKVKVFVELNQTASLENITIAVCKDIRLFLDEDVCVGAVHEYKVMASVTVLILTHQPHRSRMLSWK